MAATDIYNETSDTEEIKDTQPSGWEEPDDTDLVCSGLFKRHKWQGGDTCVRCGATKETATATREASAEPKLTRTRGASRTGDLESLFAMGWAGLGLAVERQPWVMLGAPESERVAPAVGKTLQLEAALAGKRLDKTVRRYPTVYRWLNKQSTGIAADLMPLILPPLAVGLAASNPAIARKMQPFIVSLMIPVLVEQAKLGEQQMELMSKLSAVNEETLAQANEIFAALVPQEEDGNSTQD